eukprot:7339128-Pyramimonas_sp.AAC.1
MLYTRTYVHFKTQSVTTEGALKFPDQRGDFRVVNRSRRALAHARRATRPPRGSPEILSATANG